MCTDSDSSDLTCEHSNLRGSGDFLVLVAYIHYMEEPGGGEAGKQEGQAEAEEGHGDVMTPTQLYAAFCLSPGV